MAPQSFLHNYIDFIKLKIISTLFVSAKLLVMVPFVYTICISQAHINEDHNNNNYNYNNNQIIQRWINQRKLREQEEQLKKRKETNRKVSINPRSGRNKMQKEC